MRGRDQCVARATLAVALHPSRKHWQLTHDLEGIAELVMPLAARVLGPWSCVLAPQSAQRSSGTFTKDPQQ